MRKTIKIGEKEITLESTALTSVAYKKLFGTDILATLGSFRNTDITGAEAAQAIDAVSQLAFVMAKQADHIPVKELLHLDEDAYYEWLDGFSYGDLYDPDVVTDILAVWSGNLMTSINAKN